jgi:hypothetical protein
MTKGEEYRTGLLLMLTEARPCGRAGKSFGTRPVAMTLTQYSARVSFAPFT